MEMPTVVSYSSLQQQSAEQNVDSPVPGTRGDHGGLQGFHPRQGSRRTVEQIVDIPVPGGGPQGFLPDPGLAAPSAVWRDELGQGFFSYFSRSKKVRKSPAVECEGARALELIRAERSSNACL